jgi:hypothetical protein
VMRTVLHDGADVEVVLIMMWKCYPVTTTT